MYLQPSQGNQGNKWEQTYSSSPSGGGGRMGANACAALLPGCLLVRKRAEI